jgi:hypothetical protein
MDAKEFVTSKEDTPGPHPSKYNRGDRVRLIALEEGWDGDDESPAVPQEEGVILSVDWHDWKPTGEFMYVVEVDEKYRDDHADDGLRECSEDQIQEKLS